MLGFLGFLPIFLGLREIVKLIIKQYKHSMKNINDVIPNNSIATIELESIRYRNDINGQVITEMTINQEQENTVVVDVVNTPSTVTFKQKAIKLLSYCFNVNTLKVISITLANSSDNIAVYTPLFSQASKWQIGVYIAIFLGMVFVWLIFCYFFINFRPILNIAQKYAQYIVPVVFVGIGIYIIVSSDCFPWLARAIRTKNFKNG